jgi:hypothetical protein
MNTAEFAGIIITVGALLPLLTSIVQQQTWSTPTRTIVAVLMSVLAGLVTYVSSYGLDFTNPGAIVATVVGVALASGAAYKTIWQPSGVAPALEGRTSPVPVQPDPGAAEADEDEPEVDAIDVDDLPEEDIPEEELPMPVGFDDGSKPV